MVINGLESFFEGFVLHRFFSARSFTCKHVTRELLAVINRIPFYWSLNNLRYERSLSIISSMNRFNLFCSINIILIFDGFSDEELSIWKYPPIEPELSSTITRFKFYRCFFPLLQLCNATQVEANGQRTRSERATKLEKRSKKAPPIAERVYHSERSFGTENTGLERVGRNMFVCWYTMRSAIDDVFSNLCVLSERVLQPFASTWVSKNTLLVYSYIYIPLVNLLY
jgi:hypothetical protein